MRKILIIFLGPPITVAITIIANSVSHPARYLAPAVGFVILGLILAAVLEEDVLTPAFQRMQRATTTPEARAHVLRGRRQYPRFKKYLMGFWLILGGGLEALAGSLSALVGDIAHNHKDVTVGRIVVFIALGMIVAGCLICRRVRMTVSFTDTGISVKDADGRRFIRWDEADGFYTHKPGVLTTYLVAEPAAHSTFFLENWPTDKKRGLIRICDLTDARIEPLRVDAAIDFWLTRRAALPSQSTATAAIAAGAGKLLPPGSGA